MESDLKKALHQSAVRIFEEICFMFEAPEMEEDASNQKAAVAISVDFNGAIKGRLVIEVSEGLFSSIAVNMLGEETPSAAQCRDAACEVANVICGNVLPAIAGSKLVFGVDAPQVQETPVVRTAAPSAQTRIILDQGWASLMLYLRGQGEGLIRRQTELEAAK